MTLQLRRTRWLITLMAVHCSVLTLLSVGRLDAQIPFDSVEADTILQQRDTVDQTKRFLEAQALAAIRLPTLPLIGVAGPQPAMSRIVLTRDSIEWSGAETLSDLLQKVPGVYLWRGGWIGRPEYPNYQARGPTSVEYVLDGLPYVPIGPDSVGVDPSILPLSILSRVEIERWPGFLRVHLFTRRHDRQAPSSRIGIASGDRNIARYVGALEKRYTSGLGFGLAGEILNAPTATGTESSFDTKSYWLQASYVPGPRFGVQAQLVLEHPDRKAYTTATATLDSGLTGKRSDLELRLFLQGRADGLGPRVDLLYGRTHWDGSGVKDQVNQGGIVASIRTRTLSVSGSAFNRSRWTPFDFRGEFGWAPTRWASASAEAVYQTHDANRTSRWIGVRGGLRLPLALDITASARSGSIVAAPAVLSDPAQSLTDLQLLGGLSRKWFGVEVGLARTDAFQPQPYRPYLPSIDSLRPSGPTNWLTVNWRLQPKSWLTFEGWYSNPIGSLPDGQPPTHSLSSASIRSKFWRTFPSGAFEFKLQGSVESWSPGVIGRGPGGAPITLDGATFFRSLLQIRLDSFAIYWDRYNLQASRKTYVPGFQILRYGSTFGVRWDFLN